MWKMKRHEQNSEWGEFYITNIRRTIMMNVEKIETQLFGISLRKVCSKYNCERKINEWSVTREVRKFVLRKTRWFLYKYNNNYTLKRGDRVWLAENIDGNLTHWGRASLFRIVFAFADHCGTAVSSLKSTTFLGKELTMSLKSKF